MGRSRNTGNITILLYEDPPDKIPKIHVRSSKWMAWIAEQNLPTYLHVDRVNQTDLLSLLPIIPLLQGKAIQFNQWRISHLAEFGIVNFCDISKESSLLKKRKSEAISKFSKRQETGPGTSSEYRGNNEEKSDMKTGTRDKNKTDTPRPAENITESSQNEEKIKIEKDTVLGQKIEEKVLCEIYPEEIEIKDVNDEVSIELNIKEPETFEVKIKETVIEEAISKVCIAEIILKEAKVDTIEATNNFEDDITLELESASNNENLIEAEIPRDAVPDQRLESLETKFPEKNRKYNESKSDKGIPRADSLLRKTKLEEGKKIKNIDYQATGLINENATLPKMIKKDKLNSPKHDSYERKSEINEPIRTLVTISGIDTSEVCSGEKFQVCIPEGIPTVELNPADLNDIQNCKIVCKNVPHSYIEEDIAVSVTNDNSSLKLQKEFLRCQLQSTEQNRNVVKALIAIGIFTALAILFSTLVVVRTEDTV